MQRKPKSLVLTLQYAVPIESANVQATIDRLRGDSGEAFLIRTELFRGTPVTWLEAVKPPTDAPATAPKVAKARTRKKKEVMVA